MRFPGLGIVAAVLGVVITMGALGGPPEEIGHKVAAALVGTFLGILLCYGFLGPLASNMTKIERRRTGLSALPAPGRDRVRARDRRRCWRWNSRGAAFPANYRPTFKELEAACKGGGAAPPAEAK